MLYTVQDTTMTALGDAVRKQVIGTTELPVSLYPKTELSFLMTYPFEFPAYVKKIKITGKLEHDYTTYHTKLKGLGVAPIKSGSKENVINDKNFVIVVDEVSGYEYGTNYDTDFEIIIDNNAFSFVAPTNENGTPVAYFSFTAIGLDENGNEFKYTPAEMVEKIDGLMTIPDEALTITGSCEGKFFNGQWDWFIETVGDKITTKDITNCSSMFSQTKIKELNFQINGATSSTVSMDSAFEYATNLTNCPKLNIPSVGYMQYIFSQCQSLREIKDDDWNVNTYYGHSSSSNRDGSMFGGCYSLRRITEKLLKNVWNLNTSSRSAYNSTFSDDYSLDEINKLGVSTATYTRNMFSNTFYYCCRVKDLTFDKNDDGTVKTANWSNQTIDLATYVGYAPYNNYITGYNSGIMVNKKVYDDATYQTLKNDPDWYSLDVNYSRYNHDSAVNTINSLPDCSSSGGTNTIKFTGAAGALTDGGAINTLTEEEIAVASAKGWTVSLV